MSEIKTEMIEKTFQELTAIELYEILKSRAEIFVVEQNCVYQDLDDIDYRSRHVFSIEMQTSDDTKKGKRPRVTSYLRIFEKADEPGTVHMGRVMTLTHGTGLGKILLKKGIEVSFERMGAREIYIESQVHATGFYEREGFCICSEEFLEDGIPHVQMRMKRDKYIP